MKERGGGRVKLIREWDDGERRGQGWLDWEWDEGDKRGQGWLDGEAG